MAKKFDMTIDINAKTAQAVAGIGKVDASLKTLVSQTRKVDNTFKALAGVVGSFYLVSKGIDAAKAAFTAFTDTASRFEQYEARMGAFTTSTSQMKAEMARAREFAVGFNQDIASVTETMIMMKNYGLDASNESLQTYTNTAIGAGKDVKQFAEAMADALQGENERLKEFGIKAAQQGDKIKYHWTDSMGETHDLIIEKNNQIIDSTLRAIFNEKYAGQAEAFKNSWAGQVHGMQNAWTGFKLAMMDGGLFDYVRSAVSVIGGYVKALFADGAKGAKEWSGIIVSGIESTIIGVGNMIDAWNGIKLTFTSIKAVFYATVAGIGDGINWIADAYESLKVSISNSFKAAMDAVGKAAYDAVNYILKQISNFVNSISGALGGVFEYLGQDNPFGKINLSIGEYVSNIKTATKSTEKLIDTTWSETGLKEALKDADDLVAALANEDGKKGALKIVSDIHDKLKEVTKETKAGNAEKEAARKKLEEIIAANANNTLETKKATKAAKGHADAVKKAADEYKRLYETAKGYYDDLTLTDKQKALNDLKEKVAQIEKYMGHSKALEAYEKGLKKINGEAKSLTDTLQEWMGLDNDSLFANIFSGFTDAMGSIGDALRSGGGIGDAIGSLFTKSLDFIMPGLSGLASLIGGLFSDVVSQAEIDAATGRSDFSDESLKKLGDVYESVLYPQLKLTKTMTGYLKQMNDNFGAVARAISGTSAGADLTGAGYAPTMSSGFLGFSSKTTQLLGSGIVLGGNILDAYMQGYVSELVTKSSFWGLSKKSYTTIRYTNLPASASGAIQDALTYGVASIIEASAALGFDEDQIRRQLEAYNIAIGKIDLKGLTQSEVQDRLSAVFSEIFSSAIDILPVSQLVDRYAKAGEESMEALGRLAVEYEQSSYMLQSISTVAGGVTDILDVTQYVGGLDAMNSAYTSFVDNFLSDAERVAIQSSYLNEAFDNIGIEMPKTNDEFKNLIQSFDWTQDGAAETYAELLKLSEAFADFSRAEEELRDNLDDLIKQKDDILAQSQRDILGIFTTLREQAEGLLGTLVGKVDDEASYKFYAVRYNDLKREVDSYFDNGVIRKDADMDKLKESYASLVTVSNELSNASDGLYNTDSVSAALVSDTAKYLESFKLHEEVMNVVITGDETEIANMTELVYNALGEYNDGISISLKSFSDALGLSNDNLLESITLLAEGNESVAYTISDTYDNLRSVIVNYNDELIDVLSDLDIAISAMNEANIEKVRQENQASMAEYQKQLDIYNAEMQSYREAQKYTGMSESLEDALRMIKPAIDYTTSAGYIRIYEDSTHNNAWFNRLNKELKEAGVGQFVDKGWYRQLSYSNRNDGGVGTVAYLDSKLNEYRSKIWIGDAPVKPTEPTQIEIDTLQTNKEQAELIRQLGEEIRTLRKEIQDMKDDGLDVRVAS